MPFFVVIFSQPMPLFGIDWFFLCCMKDFIKNYFMSQSGLQYVNINLFM